MYWFMQSCRLFPIVVIIFLLNEKKIFHHTHENVAFIGFVNPFFLTMLLQKVNAELILKTDHTDKIYINLYKSIKYPKTIFKS